MVATILRKIQTLSALSLVSGFALAAFMAPLPAFAQGPSTTNDIANKSIVPTDSTLNCRQPYNKLSKDNCGIIKYIVIVTNVLSAIVGVVIVLSITWAGIQYSTSKSDPQTVVAARGRITNAIIALLVYIFMVAFLQWVVPGGIF